MSPTAHDALSASIHEVDKHLEILRGRLDKSLPQLGRGCYWAGETTEGSVDLVCKRYPSERVLRERGGKVPVVPLSVDDNQTVLYWLSLRQSWVEPTNTRQNRLVYHTTSMTVFSGEERTAEKLQLFRAEWPGLRERVDGSVEFEAPGAGHPHWQFDAYQHHLRERREERQRRNELDDLLMEKGPELEDFAGLVITDPSTDRETKLITHMQRLAKIHFASSTRWAENLWNDTVSNVEAHTQSPADLGEVLNWTISTISYIRQELSR